MFRSWASRIKQNHSDGSPWPSPMSHMRLPFPGCRVAIDRIPKLEIRTGFPSKLPWFELVYDRTGELAKTTQFLEASSGEKWEVDRSRLVPKLQA